MLARALLCFGHGNLRLYRDFRYQSSCSSQHVPLWPPNQLYLTSIRYCCLVTKTLREVLILILARERARNHRRGQTESGILCWAHCELDFLQHLTFYLLLVASGVLLLCFIFTHHISMESDFRSNRSKARHVGRGIRSDSTYHKFRTFSHVLELGCEVTFFSRTGVPVFDSRSSYSRSLWGLLDGQEGSSSHTI